MDKLYLHVREEKKFSDSAVSEKVCFKQKTHEVKWR